MKHPAYKAETSLRLFSLHLTTTIYQINKKFALPNVQMQKTVCRM